MIKVGGCKDIGSLLFGFAETEGSLYNPRFLSIKGKNDRARNDNTAAVRLKPADIISLLKKKGREAYIF